MANTFRTPFFNRNEKHNTSAIEDKNCHMQQYMAIFLSKPELYSEVLTAPLNYKQELFFEKFNRFLTKYVEFKPIDDARFDTEYYFSDLSEYKVNTMNISGGEKRSGSERRNMIAGHKAVADKRNQVIDYFQRKYGWNMKESDPRLFLGHSKPWLNPSPELLVLQDYNTVLAMSYDDATFQTKYPTNLEKHLIPLAIRNKVFTDWKNEKNREFELEARKAREELKRKQQLEDELESNIQNIKNIKIEHIIIEDEDW